MQQATTTYSTLEQPVISSMAHDVQLSVCSTGSKEVIGQAHFLMDVWHPKHSILGLYEIVVAQGSEGAFALLPDGTWLRYGQLVDEAHLPPSPQHAMTAAMHEDRNVSDRELVCLVFHEALERDPSGFRLYQKRAHWETGRYESSPVPTLIEAFRLYQKARTHTLLIPYRIQ